MITDMRKCLTLSLICTLLGGSASASVKWFGELAKYRMLRNGETAIGNVIKRMRAIRGTANNDDDKTPQQDIQPAGDIAPKTQNITPPAPTPHTVSPQQTSKVLMRTKPYIHEVCTAAARGDISVLRKIQRTCGLSARTLLLGSIVNAHDDHGKAALHYAASNGENPCVKYLIDNDARIDLQDTNGLTALHHAAQNVHATVVETLLTAGARKDLVTHNGKTALHLACARPYDARPAWNLLPTNLAKITGIVSTDNDPHYRTVHTLLAQDKTKINESVSSPLVDAAHNGNTPVVSELITRIAVDTICPMHGVTPLITAIKQGYHDTVALLIDRGADVNKPDAWGHSPLWHALHNMHHAPVTHRNQAILDMLLQKNAHLSLETSTGTAQYALYTYK